MENLNRERALIYVVSFIPFSMPAVLLSQHWGMQKAGVYHVFSAPVQYLKRVRSSVCCMTSVTLCIIAPSHMSKSEDECLKIPSNEHKCRVGHGQIAVPQF